MSPNVPRFRASAIAIVGCLAVLGACGDSSDLGGSTDAEPPVSEGTSTSSGASPAPGGAASPSTSAATTTDSADASGSTDDLLGASFLFGADPVAATLDPSAPGENSIQVQTSGVGSPGFALQISQSIPVPSVPIEGSWGPDGDVEPQSATFDDRGPLEAPARTSGEVGSDFAFFLSPPAGIVEFVASSDEEGTVDLKLLPLRPLEVGDLEGRAWSADIGPFPYVFIFNADKSGVLEDGPQTPVPGEPSAFRWDVVDGVLSIQSENGDISNDVAYIADGSSPAGFYWGIEGSSFSQIDG